MGFVDADWENSFHAFHLRKYYRICFILKDFLCSGYAYCKEYPMQNHMRDAKICQIYEGANEIMRLVIAKNLF